MRELLTASYLPTTNSALLRIRALASRRSRVHAYTRSHSTFSVFSIKWFRTRRLAAVHRTSRTVRHKPPRCHACTSVRAYAGVRVFSHGVVTENTATLAHAWIVLSRPFVKRIHQRTVLGGT